jgi:hypothetical protein
MKAALALGRLATVGLVRGPARTAVRILTLAAAVALLAAMLLFIGHSLRTMTATAVGGVPLDWQGPVASRTAAQRVAQRVARQPGVLAAEPVATAPFAGLAHTAPAAGIIRAGAGSILAVSPSYLEHIHTLRFLRGGLRPGQVVLDQQLAATLQAQPGDLVTLTPRANAQPVRLRVSGVALVGSSDVLFQPLNPLVGPAPAQPPANIAILPLDTFAARIAPELPRVSQHKHRPARHADRNAMAGASAGGPRRALRQPVGGLEAGDADPQPRRAVAAGPGRLRRQPRRRPHDGVRGRPVRPDALHHARGAGRAHRTRTRIPCCARDGRA